MFHVVPHLTPSPTPTPSTRALRADAAYSSCHRASASLRAPFDRSKIRRHRFCTRALQPDSEVASTTTSTVALPPARYIATNRFKVKNAPAFEKRWCERKSRLAELDGFRFFTLMRRVDAEDEDEIDYNYISCTVWDDKDTFTAWRTGEAFKEAHGGGTLWGFVDMLVSASQTLQGPPKPAFYDGLMPISIKPNSIPEAVGGWRQVKADGKTLIPSECYVATNRFKVAEEFVAQFEERFASRDSILEGLPGFRFFSLLRRDAPQGSKGGRHSGASEPGDFNYMTLTVWEDKAAFDNWRDTVKHDKENEKEETGSAKRPMGPPQMFLGPPKPAFYEGKLVLAAEQGA